MPSVLAAVGLALFASPAAAADPEPAPPYIDHATWVSYSGLPTLRVYLTGAGRDVAGEFAKTDAQTDVAWGEVLALAPDADTAGMRSQFLCHWRFAEFAEPGKPSWDLEPWRPDVDEATMLLAGCNPGGAEKGS
ncbi:MAG: DUF2599 domain-containing protein [Actinomycetota bacterium]|nr:DUF2599 domain-containing protein [Actinomycetota bacterium]MDA2949718.1 DUF2599 domain-containing protein [Actinomycetota bacterium]